MHSRTRFPAKSAGVPGQCGHARTRGGVAPQRLQESSDPHRIPVRAVHPPDVGPADFAEVVPVLRHGIANGERQITERRAEMSGPAAHAHEFGERAYGQVRHGRGNRITGQQPRERYLAPRPPQLRERHRPQPQPADAPRSGAPGDVVGRNSRTGQDEVSPARAVIDFVAHMVPDVGHRLPLVDQAGRLPL